MTTTDRHWTDTELPRDTCAEARDNVEDAIAAAKAVARGEMTERDAENTVGEAELERARRIARGGGIG